MILTSILTFLGRQWGNIFVDLNKAKGQEARAAYLEFVKAFTPFISHLEKDDVNLNNLIVEEFIKHDLARRNFIGYLKGSRRKRFDTKWLEYKKHYNQVQKLESEYRKANTSFDKEIIEAYTKMKDEMWERQDDRRKDLLNIIQKLLEITERKL